MSFEKAIVKHRKAIVILALLLMIPSVFGIMGTRINYDMLNYLPEDMETVQGQNYLMDDFGKGAFSFIILENMDNQEVAALKSKIENVDHVDSVVWYDSVLNDSVPMDLIPQKYYDAFNTEDATMMAVFFNTSTSSDDTMDAIKEIRSICGDSCFVSGMSALVTDLKDLCEQEEPVYVAVAVALACAAMMIFMDSWLIPLVFLASIGIAIVLNLGTNIFLGEISYLTKALSAVLQLAVTMDYSIFLWHSYSDHKLSAQSDEEAMEIAIKETFSSVIGSSITTIAGFIALCFMSFTLGKDLGIVMAKGVLLGVISCVTVLPSLILLLDRPINRTKHKALIPDMTRFADFITKKFPVFLVIFAVAITPAYLGYTKTNDEVYYDLGNCLPEDMAYVIANSKLQEDFDVSTTHMALIDASMSQADKKEMIDKMEGVEGVQYVIGLESVLGSRVPEEILPDSISSIVKSDNWELLLINSQYKVASDEVGEQIDQLNSIVKSYSDKSMIIGEASCTKDMIEVTDKDFRTVTAISIIAIFIIIALVEKSFSLPIILVALIEFAIFINLGLPHYMGQSLPFIAPICISTIQLGATVDYAILMTTKYKRERLGGLEKRPAISKALAESIPSVIVSAMGLFAATFGVALYSDIDIIGSFCSLMARGAIISMLCVIFILPALLMLLDKLICKSTIDLKKIKTTRKVREA